MKDVPLWGDEAGDDVNVFGSLALPPTSDEVAERDALVRAQIAEDGAKAAAMFGVAAIAGGPFKTAEEHTADAERHWNDAFNARRRQAAAAYIEAGPQRSLGACPRSFGARPRYGRSPRPNARRSSRPLAASGSSRSTCDDDPPPKRRTSELELIGPHVLAVLERLRRCQP